MLAHHTEHSARARMQPRLQHGAMQRTKTQLPHGHMHDMCVHRPAALVWLYTVKSTKRVVPS